VTVWLCKATQVVGGSEERHFLCRADSAQAAMGATYLALKVDNTHHVRALGRIVDESGPKVPQRPMEPVEVTAAEVMALGALAPA
jgi:hypothetical protein